MSISFHSTFFETSQATNFYHTLDSYCETWILQTSFNSHPPFSPHISITMSRMWFIVFTNNLSSWDLGSVLNLFIPKNRLDVILCALFCSHKKPQKSELLRSCCRISTNQRVVSGAKSCKKRAHHANRHRKFSQEMVSFSCMPFCLKLSMSLEISERGSVKG